MHIYAIRDKMLEYFMTPFAAPGDKDVLASLATTINAGADGNAIKAAPHHFEIWRLAQVTEDGHIAEDREFLAECASLIRRNVRQTGEPGEGTVQEAVKRSVRAAESSSS